MKNSPARLIPLVLLFAFFFLPAKAEALAKFSTEFQNYYRIDPNGNTHVTYVVDQTNNLSVVYATEFGLSVNETKISNVKVHDQGYPLQPEVVKTLNQTTISFPFINKVVGKDKTHHFTIEYDTSDIATKYGSTWQINIPRLETDENIAGQLVVLTVPENFPSPAFIDPQPDKINKNVYYFSGNKIGNKTISAVFGQTQFFRAKINYHLYNDSKDTTITEIALPPDTSYQTIHYQQITPPPLEINSDVDGNYLAKYQLKPFEEKQIEASLFIKINFWPKQSLSKPLDEHLLSNSIWNYDNGIFNTAEIKNLVSAKTIYDYVVDKMKYDYEKVNRQQSLRTPAAEALINYQSALCTDFTNVFVSLARKAGIPSRELEGYALSENPDLRPISLTQDVLHAWPEYYNTATGNWTQIDPTWANTTRGIDYFNKLDFNHIVFVIHGKNPEYPIPAGGYKSRSENGKDILIEPIEPVTFPAPVFTLKQKKQNGKNITLTIENSQGVGYQGKIDLVRNDFFPDQSQTVNIPPLGKTDVSFTLSKQPLIKTISLEVIIYLNGQSYQHSVNIKPAVPQVVFFAAIGGVLAVIAILTRHIYLRRQRQKPSLHR